ncbi:hypothetical protein [uncultured Pseudokineococcus sp.]|uniref:hypothetical protein n=1 Tax=uncultured Pseudokineococcus sp. TaxID=1642928 RepID=UPI00260889D2|nr:hypothetical protein [uncultured Pseudokineococcus sp.]
MALDDDVIRLMSDYSAPSPVWTSEGCLADPSPLGLSPSLVTQMLDWQRFFDEHFHWDRGWDSQGAGAWYAEEGERLHSRLQAQLPARRVVLDLWPVPTSGRSH